MTDPRLQCPLSTRYSKLTFLIFAVTMVTGVGAGTVAVEERTDVMGHYKVSNREQCRRLCWYRKLCARYSYKQAVTSSGVNCLLHALPLQAAAVPAGWDTETADNTGFFNACAARRCTETEVCVPVGSSPTQYRCLALPADCRPPSVGNGSLTWQSTQQGQVATLTCDRYFQLTPNGSSELTCAVTSRWTPLDVRCQILCVNGGTRIGSSCACPIQYSGMHCERYIRDCTEAFNNGYETTDNDGTFLIQPVTSPEPFEVYCSFRFGGTTFPLRRETLDLATMDWATAKAGLSATGQLQGSLDSQGSQGSQGSVASGSDDLFIGLQRLHELTSQADYEVQVSLWGGLTGAGSLYNRFTVGPENSSYALTYDSYRPRWDGLGDNGFEATPPLLFSTHDRDSNNCTGIKGAPGWYGSDCNGYSLFVDNMTWPVQGEDSWFFKIELMCTRAEGFYVDL